MAFVPALRRLTFTTHVTSAVGWIGAVLVFVALAAIGLTSQDERTVRGAYLVMAPTGWFVLVPLAHASLLSGIALSLGTPWGLIRHYWVAVKLVITAFSTVILMICSRPVQDVPGGTARNWEYLLWFAALAIVGLVILSHLLGSGAHGH